MGGLHFDFREKRNDDFVLHRLYKLLKSNSAFHVQIELSLLAAGFILGFFEIQFSPLSFLELTVLDDCFICVCAILH